MKLLSIEIFNFRSINKKVIIGEKDSRFFALIGANNLGKSNILRAINLFFNNEVEPGLRFNPDVDIAQGASRAVITLKFQFNQTDDKRISSYLDAKHKDDFKEYIVQSTLVCTSNGNLQYTFAGEKGQRKSYPELIKRIQEYVSCIYIPAIKDYRTIVDAQMMRKIVGATFQGWGRGRYGSKTIGEQKEKFSKLLADIQGILDESGDYVSTIISSVVPSIQKFAFSLPYDNLEDFLGKLLFTIKEKHLSNEITLGSVGSGIQSFAIFSMLRLLHEIRPTNTHRKSKFVWLIEEPETFMHHDLQKRTYDKLKEYSKEGHIFVTTHSPVFIDKQDFSSSFVVTHKAGSTNIEYVTSKNLRDVIAGNLGVSFDDFFDFGRFNILVEGKTDRDLLLELNGLFQKEGETGLLNISEIKFIVCGGVNSIPHFYHLYNVFNRYADFVAVFDRDDDGVKARQGLVNDKIDEKRLLLIPSSANREKNGIEDLVEKKVWEKCIKRLDSDGLIEVVSQQGKITGYNVTRANRIDFKRKFTSYLIKNAKRDLKPFGNYLTLLKTLAAALN